MKERHYLTEDLAQIERLFPGAQRVALQTPFDISTGARITTHDIFQAEKLVRQWRGIVRWMA